MVDEMFGEHFLKIKSTLKIIELAVTRGYTLQFNICETFHSTQKKLQHVKLCDDIFFRGTIHASAIKHN